MNSIMNKKQKHRRNGFSVDANAGEDDFILADLDVMPDQEELSPVPLNHVLDDDETIDRLLINSDFYINDKLEEADKESDDRVIDDIDLADDFSGFNQFTIEPVEQTEKSRFTEAEEILVSDSYSRADYDEVPDEDAIDRLLVNTGFDTNDELKEAGKAPDDLVTDDIDLADDFPDFDQFAIDPVEQAEKGRFTEAEEIPVSDIYSGADYNEMPDEDAINKFLFDANDELKKDTEVPTAPVIDDISWTDKAGVDFIEQSAMAADKDIFDLEEGDLTLDKGAVNAFLNKEENLETVNQGQAKSEPIYQEALESLNNDAGITAFSFIRTGQEAIKKQIDDYENKVKKATTITYASLGFGIVALLSTVVMGVIVSSLHTKVSKLTELVSIIEEDMSGVAEKNSDMDINDSAPFIEQSNQKGNGPAEHFADPDKPQNTTVVLEKKKPSEAAVKITSGNKKTNNARAASGWSVNLTAYKELSDAKRKAANFIQKGIPVEVIAVDMNNTKWYRLQVRGFKNKENADSYAAKIKKSLNLETVFVGNI
jgi:hypothetical protein